MKKYAYVTFVMRNDSFVPGALVLAYALRKQNTVADLVCLVTSDVSTKARKALSVVYDHVVEISEKTIAHPIAKGRNDRPYLFTRLEALRLGKNGDLGFDYDKIVLLDADIMPLEQYDALFEINAPAGILNEKKCHFLEPSAFKKGLLKWHDVYNSQCPHGTKIPKQLTNRVWEDPENLGVNACLWVLEPCMAQYHQIFNSLKKPEHLHKVHRFKWPEMQYMTYFWSGKWHNVDIKYAGFNGQPGLKHLYGTHFAGIKPWQENNPTVLKRCIQFQDYQLWFQNFYELCQYVYPALKEVPKIRRLITKIEPMIYKKL